MVGRVMAFKTREEHVMTQARRGRRQQALAQHPQENPRQPVVLRPPTGQCRGLGPRQSVGPECTGVAPIVNF